MYYIDSTTRRNIGLEIGIIGIHDMITLKKHFGSYFVNSSNQQKCLDLKYNIVEQFEFRKIRELSKYYTPYEMT